MKRSAALQPLSREHHTALTLAKACERAVQSGSSEKIGATCRRVVEAFTKELEPHFVTEEQSLLPMLKNGGMLVERTLEDHRRLRALLSELRQNDAGALSRFGECLAAHVRFEERELFPALEEVSGSADAVSPDAAFRIFERP